MTTFQQVPTIVQKQNVTLVEVCEKDANILLMLLLMLPLLVWCMALPTYILTKVRLPLAPQMVVVFFRHSFFKYMIPHLTLFFIHSVITLTLHRGEHLNNRPFAARTSSLKKAAARRRRKWTCALTA